jgi:hypothetical protein
MSSSGFGSRRGRFGESQAEAARAAGHDDAIACDGKK